MISSHIYKWASCLLTTNINISNYSVFHCYGEEPKAERGEVTGLASQSLEVAGLECQVQLY